MAVFTEVSPQEAAGLLSTLGLGALQSMQGCASGIENTNYFVSTAHGDYVLTLFERLSAAQLPFYLNLMHHLAQRGIPVPAPQANAQGEILHMLKGKPAAVVTRLKGRNQLQPQAADCAQVGAMLARMHCAGTDYPAQQPNLRGLDWWTETIPVIRPHLSAEQAHLIESELQFQQDLSRTPAYQALPRGPIHADLFRDNVMFDGPTLSGFFDFYFAGCDTFVFDIAVCLNDWCIDLATGALDPVRAQAFVAAYDAERHLTDTELSLLSALLRAAALRFWTSRLWDFHLPRDAAMLQPHDPTHFERVLTLRRQQPWSYTRQATSA
ncbi:MAG: homoserine kinase [Aquabacterium sp.]|jgi:homoserine kinase type II|uniref:homoserine kinase n=1 Tax=Aquabacterium sp. TaxID=1872578 RepID=UPI001B416967|nr:homoserine kinase [Aquabacterium sp.]MBP7133266.1 homoserine kinase [Aquabacterium sp.]MBP9062819.1 homoserine kinase [Aquabacterium sp.]MDQ5925406.1 homoserine kinase type [Pseudomonadota bacterium]